MATFDGDDGDNVYVGTAQFDEIDGNGGNDTLSGGGGADVIDGGSGDDLLNGDDGSDTLRGGTGRNTLNGGAGYDALYSIGVDTVDGGSDFDRWFGDYESSAIGLTFFFDGAAGSVSNGTVLQNVEDANFKASLDGFDTVEYDLRAFPNYRAVLSADSAGFNGYLYGYAEDGSGLENIEALTIRLGAGGTLATIDSLAPLKNGGSITIDGGDGRDFLDVNFTGFDNTNFQVGADGSITSSQGTFTSFERFAIKTGGGNATVTTADLQDIIDARAATGNTVLTAGGGRDTIYSGTGSSTISAGLGDDVVYSSGSDTADGSDGADTWIGSYETSTVDRTFSYSVGRATGTLSGGRPIVGFERITYRGGASAHDAVTLDATEIGSVRLQITGSATGYSGYASLPQPLSFSITNVDALDARLGVLDDTAIITTGRSGAAAAISVDAGDGTDSLTLTSSGSDAVILSVGDDGTVTSTIGIFTGFEDVTVIAADGDHQLTGSDRNETFDVGDGTGDTILRGVGGNDRLTGGRGSNSLNGGAGDDRIYSVGGVDTVTGGKGDDRWFAEFGAQPSISFDYDGSTGTVSDGTTLASIEHVSIAGSRQNSDALTADLGALLSDRSDPPIVIGAGQGAFSGTVADILSFEGFEAVALTLGSEADRVVVASVKPFQKGGTLSIDAGGGNDVLALDASDATGFTFVVKADGTIESGFGSFSGFEGFDVTVGSGTNVVTTGAANDRISGSLAATVVADDTFSGNDGDDRLFGQLGNDTLFGGAGNDLLNGGLGIDTASFARAQVAITVDLRLTGQQNTGVGRDTLVDIENVIGSRRNDSLTGNDAANQLTGGKGLDSIDGGGGADRLIGGLGADTLTGGAGADRFVYAAANEFSSGKRQEKITDFGRADGDTIDLAAIDADGRAANGDQAFSFVGQNAFSHTRGELRFQDNGDGSLTVQGDIDGDAVADFQVIVTTATPLVAGDFAL